MNESEIRKLQFMTFQTEFGPKDRKERKKGENRDNN